MIPGFGSEGSWAAPVAQGDAVEVLLLGLVPLQVRVQHEAPLRIIVLEKQPLFLGLQRGGSLH